MANYLTQIRDASPDEGDGGGPSHLAPRKLQSASLVLVGVIGAGFLLVYLAPLLKPLAMAAFLATIYSASVNEVRKLGVPRWLATPFLAVVLLTIIGFVGVMLYGQMSQMQDDLPKYSVRLEHLASSVDAWVARVAPEYADQLKIDARPREEPVEVLPEPPEDQENGWWGDTHLTGEEDTEEPNPDEPTDEDGESSPDAEAPIGDAETESPDAAAAPEESVDNPASPTPAEPAPTVGAEETAPTDAEAVPMDVAESPGAPVPQTQPAVMRPQPQQSERVGLITYLAREVVDMKSLAFGALGTIGHYAWQVVLILLYMIFLLSEGARFRRRVVYAFGGMQASEVMSAVKDIAAGMQEYVKVKIAVSLIIAILSGMIMWAFGMPYTMLWATLVFLLNFIPYIGSAVAVTIPAVLGLLEFPSPWIAVMMGVLLIIAQFAVGNILEPRMAGKRLNVAPIMILLSLVVGGMLWGIVGMFLCAPAIMAVKVILDRIESTKPLGKMMGDNVPAMK